MEAKASYDTQVRTRRPGDLDRAALTISKTGEILPDENAQDRAADQSIVEITRANRQVYYQGFHVSLPTPYADRQFYRTITDDTFMLTDSATGEIVFAFPLPMVALNVRGRYVASYSVQGVQAEYSTKQWDRQRDHYEDQFARHQDEQPDVMATR